MCDKRAAPRHRVLKAGKIEIGRSVIDCTLRNVSDTGGALEVASPLGIPEQFVLLIGEERRSCRVVWRKEKRIGVTFES